MSAIDHIGQLTPDPANRRKHNPRNVGMIASSLGEVGAARSIVIDEHGVILAGNATIEAAAQAGIERVRVIETDGDEIVAVRRTGLTDAQKRRLAIADNRTAELAEWDVEQLLADLNAGESFDGLFSDAELDALLADVRTPEPAADPGAQVDRAEELRDKWQTARGDLWLIGPHRLLCGDATSAEDVARLLGDAKPTLMVTDPPTGGDFAPDWRSSLDSIDRATNAVQNDDRIDWSEAFALFTGDVAYVWYASLFGAEVQIALASSAFVLRSQLVWVKPHYALSRGHYHWQHEACLYAVRKGGTGHWIGDHAQSTVWQVDNGTFQGGQRSEADTSTGHGTQKPVECMARPIRNHTGDVYDPFVGSGTTIVAAEQEDRTCYAIDIDPKYIAVALERLAGMGLEPRRAD